MLEVYIDALRIDTVRGFFGECKGSVKPDIFIRKGESQWVHSRHVLTGWHAGEVPMADSMADSNEKRLRKSDTAQPPRMRAGDRPEWVFKLKAYEKADARKAITQLVDTILPYLALLALMYLTMRMGLPIWVTLLLAVPAGGFLVRLFILFHDCTHGSFLRSQLGVRILGTAIGCITFTPFADWRHTHGVHHSTAGNLDRRGVGDVWTMTVDEYEASPKFRRFLYRAFRNPIVMFGLGPVFMLLLVQRFPTRRAKWSQVRSVLLTNLVIAAIVVGGILTLGVKAYLIIHFAPFFVAGIGGIWLFYVQHQFDPSYWARSDEWGSMEAALEGSSYYKLPAVLQWFSGNIGLHHIHHLRPRIPNYNLRQCLREVPELQLKEPLTLKRSLKSIRLNIWDEEKGKLISFRALDRLLRSRRAV